MKFFIFFIFLGFYSCVNGQSIIRKIVDRQTGSPLPYATIKILHKPRGVIASDKGEFNLTIDPADSILISYVGYQPKILLGKEIGIIIDLNKKIKLLEEITIGQKKLLRTILLGDENENFSEDINWGPSNGGKDELAQKIELPDSSLYYKIQKIYLPVRKSKCFGTLLLHIYTVDSASEFPDEELSLIPIEITKKNIKESKAIIDISSQNLYLHKSKFFFVSVSWPDETPFSKCITTILLSKSSNAKTCSRSLYGGSYKWFPFGHWKDLNGNSYEVRTFYSVEVDEMK